MAPCAYMVADSLQWLSCIIGGFKHVCWKCSFTIQSFFVFVVNFFILWSFVCVIKCKTDVQTNTLGNLGLKKEDHEADL